MSETFITFGVQYKANPQHPEEAHPFGMFGDGYAVIAGVEPPKAREVAHALFDQKWAFMYDEQPREQFAPAGEILRVAVLRRYQIQEAREVIQETFEAAEGDSNDEEIDALQKARDLLAEIVGWKEEA